MKIKKILLIFFAVFFLFQAFEANAQSKRGKFAVCFEKQMWLMNEAEAVSIGKCDFENFFVSIKFEKTETGKEITNSEEGEKLLDYLRANFFRKVKKEDFNSVSIDKTKLTEFISSKQLTGESLINPSNIPLFLKEFLNPIMRFYLTSGWLWGDTYYESQRFSIEIESANPTIAEMVEAARKNNPDKQRVEKYGEFYILKTFNIKRERYDQKKTAADYSLKNYDVLVLSTDSERMLGLPDGIR